jgi:sulfotransferase
MASPARSCKTDTVTLHALAGLPRSGSTLLANVLNQHPDVHVSGTSALQGCVAAVTNVLSNSPEVVSDLANIPDAYDTRFIPALRGLVNGWYSARSEGTVIDKSRGWILRPALLTQMDPAAVLIACVRDPRDVVASIIRRDRATAAFNTDLGLAVQDVAAKLMDPDGMVGGPIHHIEAALHGKIPVQWVRFETFTATPETVMGRLTKALGLPEHDWDFDNVENVSTDLDAIYRGKYPHNGSGAVRPVDQGWSDVLSAPLAARIAASYPLFMHTFDYKES